MVFLGFVSVGSRFSFGASRFHCFHFPGSRAKRNDRSGICIEITFSVAQALDSIAVFGVVEQKREG